MKIARFILVALFPLLLLQSCKDDTYSFTAKIGAQEWVSNGYAVAVKANGKLLINAYNDVLPPFVMVLSDNAAPGTYIIDSLNNVVQYGSDTDPYVPHNNRPGVVVVTAVDDVKGTIAGTFYVTLFNVNTPTDSIIITEGKFDIMYE